MKRLNPATGEPFKFGDVREDGYVFFAYRLKKIKRNGEIKESWLSPAAFEKQKEGTKRRYENNAERAKELAKRWKQANPERVKELDKRWKQANPERVKESRKRRYEANSEREKETSKLWQQANPERAKEHVKRWRQANPDKINSHTAKRRSAKLQRTPPWLTKEQLVEIESFYTKAKDLQTLTGIEYHVDHIIPLQGKLVSGLHVPWNLQVIPAVENIKKSNNYEPTFENTTADVA